MENEDIIENNGVSEKKRLFSSFLRRWKEFRLFSRKTNESSQENSETQQKYIKLRAPQPLTSDQFDEIVIRRYINLMTEQGFQNAFQGDLTEENISAIIKQRNYPKGFIKVIEKSLMVTYKAMQNKVLENEVDIAWNIAERLADFSADDLQYIHYKEGDSPDLRPYIRMRFSDIDSMRLTLNFVDTVEEANQISSSASSLSMKNAESIYNKLRTYEQNLDAEQKSKIYYLSSELFRRAQIVPGIYHEPKPCDKEIHCLRMVLDNTSLPSMVDCCTNRLSSDTKILQENTPLLISAYKRVLSKQHTIYPEDAYRFNSQIAKLYLQNVHINSSFSGLDIDSVAALRWSEYFYKRAYSKAKTDRQKYKALNAVSKIQSSLGETVKARKTALTAAKLLPIPENYEKLLDLALTEDKNAISVIKKTIRQIQKEKMPFEIKKILYDKALLITHQKTKDEKVISSVENLLPSKKLTPNKKIAQNVSTYE